MNRPNADRPSAATVAAYRTRSFWLDELWRSGDDDLVPRTALAGDLDVDVAIVGGGLTGLWTARHLQAADPSARIAIVEAEICGFGASGRNGGWCSALFPVSAPTIAAQHGRSAAIAMQDAMDATVDAVGADAAADGIDCHYVKGGTLTFARNAPQERRLRAQIGAAAEYGVGADHLSWVDADAAAKRIAVTESRGALFTPDCAALHPARLARGLSHVVESRGVQIFELTRATAIEPHVVETTGGRIRADVVVRALEGFTPQLRQYHRLLAPVYSLMVATEPLPDAAWDEIGWDGFETMADDRRMLIYAQRTRDGRIAFGGRGAPYHFASSVRPAFDRNPKVYGLLQQTLWDLWPVLRRMKVQLSHRWGGPLAIPRDWHPSVGFDRSTGFAWGGGYVGDGLATTHLAGRTLADLVGGRSSALTELCWVQHEWRNWEPEPLRWLGINGGLRLTATADRREAASGREPAWTDKLLSLFIDHI